MIAETDTHTTGPDSIPGPGSVGYRGFRRGIRRRYRKRHGVEQGKRFVPFNSKCREILLFEPLGRWQINGGRIPVLTALEEFVVQVGTGRQA